MQRWTCLNVLMNLFKCIDILNFDERFQTSLIYINCFFFDSLFRWLFFIDLFQFTIDEKVLGFQRKRERESLTEID